MNIENILHEMYKKIIKSNILRKRELYKNPCRHVLFRTNFVKSAVIDLDDIYQVLKLYVAIHVIFLNIVIKLTSIHYRIYKKNLNN